MDRRRSEPQPGVANTARPTREPHIMGNHLKKTPRSPQEKAMFEAGKRDAIRKVAKLFDASYTELRTLAFAPSSKGIAAAKEATRTKARKRAATQSARTKARKRVAKEPARTEAQKRAAKEAARTKARKRAAKEAWAPRRQTKA